MASERLPAFTYPLLHVKPGERLAEALLEVGLGELSALLRELKVSPLQVTVMRGARRGRFTVHLIVRLEDLGALKDAARRLGIREVKAEASKPMEVGWGASRFFSQVRAGRMRLVGFLGPMLARSLQSLRSKIGHATDIYMYHLGFGYGSSLSEYLLGLLGLRPGRLTREELRLLMEHVADHARALGMGVVELRVADVRRGTFELDVHDCWEAELYLEAYGRAKGPTCFFTRGCLAGTLSYATGRTLRAEEIRCRALGHDVCTFLTYPA